MAKLEQIIEEEEMVKVQSLMEKNDLTAEDIKRLIKSAGKGVPKTGICKKMPYEKNNGYIKFGVLSDLHMGHKCYQPKILEHAVKTFNKEKVEFVCIPGDILEGMSGREGHVYELEQIGATAQLKYGVEQLKKIKQQIYAITATNSHDGWFSSKNNMGFEVGPELERQVPNFEFLGYDEAEIVTKPGMKIRLSHPGDGTAYAISYKLQKYLNAISGGKKPDILLQGHYHKAEYLFYRNVHAFDAGCLEAQTTFMKKKQTPAMLGYWVIEAWGNKKGVDRIRPMFVPFYEV